MKVGDLVNVNSYTKVLRPRAHHSVAELDGAHRSRLIDSGGKKWEVDEDHQWDPIRGTGVVIKLSSDKMIEVSMVGTLETYVVRKEGVTVISRSVK